METWHLNTIEVRETEAFADKLGGLLKPGDLVTLSGDLGAGKTTFTKALAKALGVTKNVNSPTFTIMKEYRGYVPFYHMDAYRLEDSFEDLGLDEYFEGEGVTIVEWPEMIEEQLPTERLALFISYEGETARQIRLEATGERYEAIVKELKQG
ncbi:tRNA (adenosine(37)-N6)-threonylcarbamoyltransferase complex ATPase subunit type 1 TsaE [Paenalkalicoccus suaedae]|uniref:tRNA threonylcarbamoyladenosine biosynthesis protein TsaE n=1 Tax=Paenalkalicoccus suaedae TaxID=2592382 RepID=A0A859FAA5_9BACI|nr:tRNA (adenosine(37)-N6)-threonylcarbamoyltransferase complex ATPase subunit type 1 TsaE [Paenalkalicoccus suaedae]QKS70203.1 tRNA (adenosine(37)-N6)-threonylcarbamoyltransferase complex ATPase subunit type 1 TsaE [Paenalkalicoccus suaedae]